MLSASAAALLLASSLASASPTPQRRSASIIPVRPRSANNGSKIFNASAVKEEIQRAKAKYSGVNERVAWASATNADKRSTVLGGAPYDIKLGRRADSGPEPLSDEFDQIDECK